MVSSSGLSFFKSSMHVWPLTDKMSECDNEEDEGELGRGGIFSEEFPSPDVIWEHVTLIDRKSSGLRNSGS